MIDAYSYDRFAGDVEALTEAISTADPELVPELAGLRSTYENL